MSTDLRQVWRKMREREREVRLRTGSMEDTG